MKVPPRHLQRFHGARLAIVSALAVLLLALPASASAFTWGDEFEATGPHQTIYDWSVQRCTADNIPDAPAHAIRDARNRIQILISHWVNYRLMGRNFNNLSYQCQQHLVSTDSGDPASFNNREWLGSVYTKDGRTIHALLSNEYQGNRFVSFCDSGQFFKCLYFSVTAAVSRNSGDNYTQQSFPLVASSAYQYFKETGPYGNFGPSNIVKRSDGYYYALYHAEDYLAQKVGTCVMRTRDLRNPGSWKSWNGIGYDVPRRNPYVVVPMERAEPFTCEPVSFREIEAMSHSLTWNTYLKKWLLVGNAGKYDPDRGENVYGFFYSTSSDLINWSDRKLLVEVPLPHTWVCGDEFPWGFPSVIDHESRARDFHTSDRDFHLYYVLNNRSGCVSGLDRDLVRVPVRFKDPPPEP